MVPEEISGQAQSEARETAGSGLAYVRAGWLARHPGELAIARQFMVHRQHRARRWRSLRRGLAVLCGRVALSLWSDDRELGKALHRDFCARSGCHA